MSKLCPRHPGAMRLKQTSFTELLATLKQKEHLLIIPTQEGDCKTLGQVIKIYGQKDAQHGHPM